MYVNEAIKLLSKFFLLFFVIFYDLLFMINVCILLQH